MDLKKILDEHLLWLNGKGGSRADLRCANLRNADLRNADLSCANQMCIRDSAQRGCRRHSSERPLCPQLPEDCKVSGDVWG